MIGAVDLEISTGPSADAPQAARPDSPTGYLGTAGWRVYEAARRRGVYLRPLGNVVYVAPPLNIPDAELAELLGKVREAIEEVVKR
jgi:adenosylmethionine-8-amino-7-oxononanoate aminotransferase